MQENIEFLSTTYITAFHNYTTVKIEADDDDDTLFQGEVTKNNAFSEYCVYFYETNYSFCHEYYALNMAKGKYIFQ